MKASRKITAVEWHDRLYEVSSQVLGSIVEGTDLELFKEQTRRERYCFVARRLAETLLDELGFEIGPNSSKSNDEGPDPDGSKINKIDPRVLEQMKKNANKD